MLITALKRQVRADYLRRIEKAARTTDDFRDLSEMYDKLDANRERRERYYEIGSVESLYELDYCDDGAVIPGRSQADRRRARKHTQAVSGRYTGAVRRWLTRYERETEIYRMV